MGAGTSRDETEDFDLSELEQLPQDLRHSIELQFMKQKSYIQEIETKYEKLRVDSEQRYFEIERSLIDSQSKLSAETTSAAQLRVELSTLETKYNETANSYRTAQRKEFEFTRQKDALQRTNINLEAEKHELSNVLEQKNRELEKLTDEWKSMSLQVNEANKEKIAAMSKCDAAEAQFVTLEHKASRVSQEKEQLQQEKMWMERELKEKTDSLLSLRKEHASKVLQLQSTLDEKLLELRQQEELHTAQTLRTEKLSNQTETYIQRLREQKDLQAQSDQQYRGELQAQEKLTQLYKNSSEEADKHVQQLTTAVEELQKMLKQAAQATKELETLRKEDEIRNNEEHTNQETVINQLKRELEDANKLLEVARKKGVANLSDENLEALSPSAAAASRLLKSGMTLTQIYSEYVQATENLQVEKDENRRLNQYLDQILQEIEEKAPIMKQQREDYEKCLETIDQIERQLDTAMVESEKLRVHDDESSRRLGEVSRESGRLKMQCGDMSAQIRMLLKELEEARGTVVHMSPTVVETMSPSLGGGDRSAAQSLISDKLVTFRNIEELQEQNQRLLGIVRDLSERQEEQEKVAVDSKTQDLNSKLEEALGEIEDLKSTRDRAATMVESIVRQRDMYRVLLAQTAGGEMMPVPSSDQSLVPGTPGSQVAAPQTPRTPASPSVQIQALEETGKALKELQEEFSLYRREKGENEKLLNSQLEQFRSSNSEMKMQNAKLASQLDYSAERYKVLQSNIEGYMKEIAALREKNQTYSSNVVKHEQSNATLREELMKVQGQLTKAEVQVQHLNSQNGTLRSIEARLTQEKESMLRENRSTQLLMANLQAIQNNLERSEFETKTTLNNRIAQLERENTAVRRKLENGQDHQRGIIQSLEQQLTQARELLGQEDQSHRETQRQLKMEKVSTEQLKTQLSEMQTQYEAAQTRLKLASQAQKELLPVQQKQGLMGEDEKKDLQNQISATQEELKGLKDQLNKAKQHAEQYKSIAESMEKSMIEQNKTSKEFAEKLEGEIKAKQEAVDQSQSLLQAAEHEKQRLFEANLKLNQDITSSSADLRRQLKTLQAELEMAIDRREAAIATESVAKTDAQEHQKRASEAQDKYERELILHAANVNALAEVKQELEGFHDRLRKAEEAAKDAKGTLSYQKHCWEEQEKLMKEDRLKLQKRNDDILEQNSCLHDQLEQLSDQMCTLQKRKNDESQETDEMAEKMVKDPTEKTPDQLLEVIKFIRKEKNILEAKLDVVQAESCRYRQRLEFVEKQLEDSSKTLQEERERAQVSIQTAAQHADLLRKVENMNLLQDSNRHLREEKDRLTQQMKSLEARAQKLEEEIEPLQANLRDVAVERDTLQAENTAQRGEIDSWKSRTNHLIEQCERFDPEEFKQAVKDRDELKQSVSSQNEEINKLKVEKVNLNMQISQLKNEEAAAKKKIEELTAEKTKLTQEGEAKDKDLEAKNQTISQLKLIGRRYRKETQDANQELEKLKKNQQLQGNIQELQEKLKVSEEKLKASEEKVKNLEEKASKVEASLKSTEMRSSALEQQKKTLEERLKILEASVKTAESAKKAADDKIKLIEEKQGVLESNVKAAEGKNKVLETEKSSALASVQGLEREKADLQKQTGETEARMKAMDTQITKMNEEISGLKQSNTTSDNEKVEAEKQRDQTKKLLASAKHRLIQQKTEIEALKKDKGAASVSSEDREQKLSCLQAECEQLKKDLSTAQTTAKQDLETLQKHNTELQQRCFQLQKLLEVYQRQIQSPPGSQTQTPSEPPKTANIRPMTAPTSSPQVRMAQATPIQPVRSTVTVETRAMASIRPMAVSQATSGASSAAPTTPSSQTPMATVHPTTQEGEGMMSPLHVSTQGSAQGSTQGRPTQTVQPVSPHVEEPAPADQSPIQESATVSTQASTTITSSLFTSTSSSSMATVVVTQATSREPAVSGSSGIFSGGIGSGASIFGGKRAREEDQDTSTRSDSQPEGPSKKTKTGEESDTPVSDTTPVSQEVPVATTSVTTAVARPRSEANVALVEPEPAATTSQSKESKPEVTLITDPVTNPQEESEELPEFTETEEDEPKEEEDPRQVGSSSGARRPSQPAEVTGGDTGDSTQQEGDESEPVIVLLDENDQAGFDDQGDFEEEEFVEEAEEEEEMEEQFEEERMESHELQPEGIEDDEDVVIIADDEEEVSLAPADDAMTTQVGAMETQVSGSSGTSSSGLSSQTSDPTRLGPPVGVARLQSSGSRTQLQPFTFGGEAAAEFGDDGIVPSTPTLFVPRRNDGFAEAISSPLVSRQFVFGNQSEASSGPDFGQLASQGLDAPLMDFSHFERSDTRSPQPGTGSSGPSPSQAGSVKPTLVVPQQAPADQATEGATAEEVAKPQEVKAGSQEQSEQQQTAPQEEVVIRYPPTRPTLIEEPQAGASGQAEKPSQQIQVVTSDKLDDSQSKTKIERIVWDHPSSPGSGGGVVPPSGGAPLLSPHPSGSVSQPSQQPSHPQAAPPQQQQGPGGPISQPPQAISTLGNTPQRSFNQAQRSFRSRGSQGRGQNTAFRGRISRGPGQMRQRGMPGQNMGRGGNMGRGRRGPYRGQPPF